MKMKTSLLISALFIFLLPGLASAQSYKKKFKETLSYASSELSDMVGNYDREFATGFSSGKLSTGNDVTQIYAGASHLWLLQDQIQAGGELGFTSISSNGNSISYLDLVAVGAYNLENSLSNSLYAKAGLGLFGVPGKNGDYESKFGFFIGGGKRFRVWDHVSFSPELRMVKKGDLDPSIEFQFLNLSILY